MSRPGITRFAAGAVVIAALAATWTAAANLATTGGYLARVAVIAGTLLCARAIGTSLLHTLDTLGARWRLWRLRHVPPPTAGTDLDGDGRCTLSGDIAAAFTPGYLVYRLSIRGGQVYVGSTGRDRPRSVAERLLEHVRDKQWAREIAGAHAVAWRAYPDYATALKAEMAAIATELPVHNIAGKGRTRR